LRIGANYAGFVFESPDVKNRETYENILAREFNAMTAGVFWGDGSHPSRTEFDFSEMDYKVNWAYTRGMELHGHTLVWFAPTELPDWLKTLPKSEVETAMNEYIDKYVGRYKGKIKLWNVVNEPVNDGASTLRTDHVWFNAMGHDYIAKAFIRAHAADPTAVLTINEYGIEGSDPGQEAKFNGVKKLLQNLLDKGVPVHALEWQMHLAAGETDPELLATNKIDPEILLARMNEIADMGLDNYISELDVVIPKLPANPTAAELKTHQQNLEAQKQMYKMVIDTFLRARRHKDLIFWGVRDGDPNWNPEEHPLLFDENFQKKPAYDGVVEALLGQ
jgi:endo-1,4-beta-xylanase